MCVSCGSSPRPQAIPPHSRMGEGSGGDYRGGQAAPPTGWRAGGYRALPAAPVLLPHPWLPACHPLLGGHSGCPHSWEGLWVLPLSQVCVWDLLLGFKGDSRARATVQQREPEIISFKFSPCTSYTLTRAFKTARGCTWPLPLPGLQGSPRPSPRPGNNLEPQPPDRCTGRPQLAVGFCRLLLRLSSGNRKPIETRHEMAHPTQCV